jgi:hypothetical protein
MNEATSDAIQTESHDSDPVREKSTSLWLQAAGASSIGLSRRSLKLKSSVGRKSGEIENQFFTSCVTRRGRFLVLTSYGTRLVAFVFFNGLNHFPTIARATTLRS